ncbi:MAG: hypothetical protein ACK50S_00670 [bacterium]|jgi:hypothetical protein
MLPVLPMFSRAQVRLAGYVLAGLLLIACVALAKQRFDAWVEGIDRAGYDRAKAEHVAEALRASDRARAVENDAAARVAQLEEQHRATQSDLARAAAGARAELDRLRNQLAAVRPGDRGPAEDPAAAGRLDGSAAAAVAGECASQLVEVAESADAVAERLRSLQTYVSRACVTPRL